MFFILSKIFNVFLSPLTWIFILLCLALILKNQTKRRRLLISALILFYFFGNSFIVEEFVRQWEVQVKYEQEIDSSVKTAIVLGGGIVNVDNRGKTFFRSESDRMLQALGLLKDKKIEKIIFSGGFTSVVYPEMLESPVIKRYLRKIGVADSSILIDSLSNNTFSNAVNTKKILKDNNIKGKCLLITSAMHMRRAEKCFAKQNIEILAYCSSKKTGPRHWEFEHLLIPNTTSFDLWDKLLHEWFGLLTYKISGYI